MHAVPASVEHRSAPLPPPEFVPYLPPALAEINVPAYVLDRDGRIRWLNAAAEKLTGNAVGSLVTDVVELDRNAAQRILERRLAGIDQRDHSVTIRTREGEQTRVEISSVPLGDDHRVVGMFGLAIPSDRQPRPVVRGGPLTPRQQEVLELLADGTSTKAIAADLFVTEQTVRNHVREILGRLGANSRLGAVAIARRDGLV